MQPIKLTIKPKHEPTDGQCLNSSGYSVKLNDWELGRGVTDFKLEMPAGEKPKAIIAFTPDVIDVSEMTVVGNNLIGKYLEISGEVAGRIEFENEKELLVRKAFNYPSDNRCALLQQALYIDKRFLDNYWVKIIDIPYLPDVINSENSTISIRKYLNM